MPFPFNLLARWRARRAFKRRIATRSILPYFDGRTIRYGDPFALYRTIMHAAVTTDGTPVDLQRIAGLVDEGREPETTQFVEAVARAFGVQRWDEATKTGLTDWEVINLMSALTYYVEDVKKNSSPGPMPPPSTELESSTCPAAPAETTKPPLPSGSS